MNGYQISVSKPNALSGEIKTSNQSLSETIKGLDKRLYQIFVLVIALIAFIAVVVGVPQIIVAMQRKDLHEQDERIKAQQNQIEALRHEIDERKHEHIAAP
jgi:cell division protein FtsL